SIKFLAIETNKINLQKRNRELVEEIEDSSESEKEYTTNNSNIQPLPKNKKHRPFVKI
ncbi:4432_t:CDS:1, partial [Cetraspora pellucida]